jgi:hypothetical protein
MDSELPDKESGAVDTSQGFTLTPCNTPRTGRWQRKIAFTGDLYSSLNKLNINSISKEGSFQRLVISDWPGRNVNGHIACL